MEVIFLGTGTSQGVPMIAHEWPDLDLDNPRNWRTRPSIHVVMGGTHIQIDAAQEFRMQCLANDIRAVDLFLLTHGHADHILGMDDLRRFCVVRDSDPLPVYSTEEHLRRVREIYPYATGPRPEGRYYPHFKLQEMPESLDLGVGTIRCTRLPHGPVEVLGFVFTEEASGRRVAYFTDCKEVPEEAVDLASGADVVVLDALQPRPHPTHMSVDEALAAAERIGGKQTWFTHLTFFMDDATWADRLPPGVALAWDGLRIQI